MNNYTVKNKGKYKNNRFRDIKTLRYTSPETNIVCLLCKKEISSIYGCCHKENKNVILQIPFRYAIPKQSNKKEWIKLSILNEFHFLSYPNVAPLDKAYGTGSYCYFDCIDWCKDMTPDDYVSLPNRLSNLYNFLYENKCIKNKKEYNDIIKKTKKKLQYL